VPLLASDCEDLIWSAILPLLSGSNSVVESRLPKPLVAGSIPVSRSNIFSRRDR
jgi:hypothetical protein